MINLKHIRKNTYMSISVIILRYLMGGTSVFAGFGKALGRRFMPMGSLQLPENGITIDIFFETLYRTNLWWQFIGCGQVVSGLLLLTQRYSTLGAVAFFPISANIFMITLSMNFNYTPVITGLNVVGNIFLLFWDYEKLRMIISPNKNAIKDIHIVSDQLNTPHYWEFLGICIFVMSLIFGIRGAVLEWFTICTALVCVGLIMRKPVQKYFNLFR